MKVNINRITQKITIFLIILILFNFTIPNNTYGVGDAIDTLVNGSMSEKAGLITQPIKAFLVTVFDAAIHLVEDSLVGFR